jgi:glutamate dehydrogenase
MSGKYLLGHKKLMKLSKRLSKDYSQTDSVELNLFVTHYFASTSRSDLSDRGNDAMYDNLRQAWVFYQQRDTQSPKIEFLHFDSGAQGNGEEKRKSEGQRQCSGTRILVLQTDMPFLVDSIRQALTRSCVIIKYINNSVLYSERNARGFKGGRQVINNSAQRDRRLDQRGVDLS